MHSTAEAVRAAAAAATAAADQLIPLASD